MGFRFIPYVISPLTMRIVSSFDSALDPTIITEEELGSELVDGWTNNVTHPFETLTTTGSTISSAINTTGFGIAYKDIGAVVAGELYKCVFTATKVAGNLPGLFSAASSDNTTPWNYNAAAERISEGLNTIYFTITYARANEYICWQNVGGSGESVNFSIAGFSLKKIIGGTINIVGNCLIGGATDKVGFYGTAPIALQTGVAVSAAGIHAALVALGLITA